MHTRALTSSVSRAVQLLLLLPHCGLEGFCDDDSTFGWETPHYFVGRFHLLPSECRIKDHGLFNSLNNVAVVYVEVAYSVCYARARF